MTNPRKANALREQGVGRDQNKLQHPHHTAGIQVPLSKLLELTIVASRPRTRLTRRARHDEIMAAALRVACDVGYTHVTRDDIALAAGCSPALVSEMLGTMTCMRRSLMRAAIANHVLPIIAQGLSLRDPHALRAPAELRALAAESLE